MMNGLKTATLRCGRNRWFLTRSTCTRTAREYKVFKGYLSEHVQLPRIMLLVFASCVQNYKTHCLLYPISGHLINRTKPRNPGSASLLPNYSVK